MAINKTDGEFFVRLGVTLAAAVLVMFLAKIWFFPQAAAPTAAVSADVISWRDAAGYYGKYATVEGEIVAAHNSGKVCFLNFHSDYKRYFTAVIFASAFSRFPQRPQDYFLGKKVRVKGFIKEYQGKPEIILNDPDQIEVLSR